MTKRIAASLIDHFGKQPISLAIEQLEILDFDVDLLAPKLEALIQSAVAAWPDYDGNYDKQADALEPGSRAKFMDADKLYFFHTKGLHLKINSGRRDVRRQAQLWIKWKEGTPGYNPANLPGCSFHNYGIAIDIIRDHEAIADAVLTQCGWQRTHRDEEWHYDCKESPAHGRVEGLVASLRAGKAGQWHNAWLAIRKDQESRQKLVTDFTTRRAKFERDVADVRSRIDRHNQEAAVFNAQVEKWQADKTYLLARIDDFNRRVDRANTLAQQINSMPPGPSRDALIREWSALRDQIELERPQLEAALNELNQRASLLEREGNRLVAQKQQIEAEIARLEKEQQDLQSLITQIDELAAKIQKNEELMAKLLTEIESIVGAI